ncbi:Set1/Ash2 histone methyltransferase complex subunit ASH2 [Chytridiales sp. JEL 0842]|nr:Set1/Ash2 histone methyltransferase complex subunit ASH2 [Chytridiales sp. JEL 0842]
MLTNMESNMDSGWHQGAMNPHPYIQYALPSGPHFVPYSPRGPKPLMGTFVPYIPSASKNHHQNMERRGSDVENLGAGAGSEASSPILAVAKVKPPKKKVPSQQQLQAVIEGPQCYCHQEKPKIDVCHIALYNLHRTRQGRTMESDPSRQYFTKKELKDYIDENWDRFWLKPRPQNWSHTVSITLTGNADRFTGGDGKWSLTEVTVPPSSDSIMRRAKVGGYDIQPDGSLVELEGAFNQQQQGGKAVNPQVLAVLESNGTSIKKKRKGGEEDGSDAESVGGQKNRSNKGSASGTPEPGEKKPKKVANQPKRRELPPEIINPSTAILLYPDVDNPRKPVRISNQPWHTAPQIKVSADGLSATTEKGYRMAKASHGVYDGNWYFEITFQSNGKGHTRVGWSQISGDLQAPCGYDHFSYSFRDSPGTLFHESNPVQDDSVAAYAEGFGEGDVLGVAILLPPLEEKYHEALMRRLWQIDSPYVQFRSNPMPKIPGSEIRYYKNGKDLGVAFRDLNLGKYHPAISLFGGATVSVNFGPNFSHPVPEPCKGYDEVAYEHRWFDFAAFCHGEVIPPAMFGKKWRPNASTGEGAGGAAVAKPKKKKLNFPMLGDSKKKKKKKKASKPALALVPTSEDEKAVGGAEATEPKLDENGTRVIVEGEGREESPVFEEGGVQGKVAGLLARLGSEEDEEDDEDEDEETESEGGDEDVGEEEDDDDDEVAVEGSQAASSTADIDMEVSESSSEAAAVDDVMDES